MALYSVPQSAQTLNQTQPTILANFQNIDSGFSADHQDFNTGANSGYHNTVTLLPQSGTPTPIASNQMVLYNQIVASVPNLFLLPILAGTPINLSAVTFATGTISGGTSGAILESYSMYLPSGVIIQAGYTTGTAIPADSSTTFTFPTAFPTYCFAVIPVMLLNNNTGSPTNTLWVVNYSATSFSVHNRKGSSSFPVDISFIAIGN